MSATADRTAIACETRKTRTGALTPPACPPQPGTATPTAVPPGPAARPHDPPGRPHDVRDHRRHPALAVLADRRPRRAGRDPGRDLSVPVRARVRDPVLRRGRRDPLPVG